MAYFTSRESFVKAGLTYASTDELDDEDCYICYHSYQLGNEDPADAETDVPTRLPCSHIFGKRCILRWTRESNTCPYCRAILYDKPSNHRGLPMPSRTFSFVFGQNHAPNVSSESDGANPEPSTSRVLSWDQPAYVTSSGLSDSSPPARAPHARRQAGARLPSHVHSTPHTRARTCNICHLRHGEQDCRLVPNRRVALSLGVPHNAQTAKRLFTQTARILAACIPSIFMNYSSSLSPEGELLEMGSASSDEAMEDLVESHEQWMIEVAEEAEFDYDEDDEDVVYRHGILRGR